MLLILDKELVVVLFWKLVEYFNFVFFDFENMNELVEY